MNKLLQTKLGNSGSNIVLKPYSIKYGQYVVTSCKSIIGENSTETMPNGLAFTPPDEDSTSGNQ
jgi:hypothetical protein